MLAPATERDRAPQIFTFEYYQRLYDVEERHWWSIGMRAIAEGLLAPRLRDSADLRILDAGCGTGGTLAWLERFATPTRIVGIDYSRYALEFCQRRRRWALAQASITRLPFPDRFFDLVVCTDVIQHLPRDGSDRVALQECHRTLRPGGVLFLRTNVRVGPANGRPPEAQTAGADPNYHQYSRRELVDSLAAAGFAVDTVSYVNMLPALAATWLRRLEPHRAQAPIPGANPGLRMRVPPPWLNAALKRVMGGEAWYLTRCRRGLPYGHSLVCLAAKPAPRSRGESRNDRGVR